MAAFHANDCLHANIIVAVVSSWKHWKDFGAVCLLASASALFLCEWLCSYATGCASSPEVLSSLCFTHIVQLLVNGFFIAGVKCLLCNWCSPCHSCASATVFLRVTHAPHPYRWDKRYLHKYKGLRSRHRTFFFVKTSPCHTTLTPRHQCLFFSFTTSLLWFIVSQVVDHMLDLWAAGEKDMLEEHNQYRLSNTGQGLQRVQVWYFRLLLLCHGCG